MEQTTIKIGGNNLQLWYGKILTRISKYYERRGEKLIAKGSKTIISNPTCKLCNAFTIIINFTVDNKKKYQLVLEGDYKKKYKEEGTEENPITNQEMFLLIRSNQDRWFLKE